MTTQPSPGELDSMSQILMGNRDVLQQEHQVALQRKRIQDRDAVLAGWLEGKPLSSIAKEIGCTYEHARTMLKDCQGEIRDIILADRESLVIDNIQAFRHIQQIAYQHVRQYPSQASSLLTVAMRAQENIGKIQGVITDKVHHIGSVEHLHKKVYDFADNFPDAIPATGVRELEAGEISGPADIVVELEDN